MNLYPLDIDKIKDESKFMNREKDKGFVNTKTGASIGIKHNGDNVIATNTNCASISKNDESSNTKVAIEINEITNRKNILTDEITINKHKLNPFLYELTDMVQVNNNSIGNLSMYGTVLVKAWESHLNKYVLIRRPIVTPIFSHTLNLPDAPEKLGLDLNISNELTEMRNNDTKKVDIINKTLNSLGD